MRLLTDYSFITITFLGNIVIVSFSMAFYFIEGPYNAAVGSFLDALWWGFATATTVGYGDIVPITVPGKVIGIGLMLIGTALFAIYMGIFSQAILEDDSFKKKGRDKTKT